MTVHKAAEKIIQEANKPLTAREIAKSMYERGWVSSNAKDPIYSLTQTLEKTIRSEIYNIPELVFVYSHGDRMVGLPSMASNDASHIGYDLSPGSVPKVQMHSITLKIPPELMEKIQLAVQAKLASSLDETISLLLKKGLSTVTQHIRSGLAHQLSKLDEYYDVV